MCSKTYVKRPLKNRQNKDLNDKRYLNEGRKYSRMLPLEHSAIRLTCIKLYLVMKTNMWYFFLKLAIVHRFYCRPYWRSSRIFNAPVFGFPVYDKFCENISAGKVVFCHYGPYKEFLYLNRLSDIQYLQNP